MAEQSGAPAAACLPSPPGAFNPAPAMCRPWAGNPPLCSPLAPSHTTVAGHTCRTSFNVLSARAWWVGGQRPGRHEPPFLQPGLSVDGAGRQVLVSSSCDLLASTCTVSWVEPNPGPDALPARAHVGGCDRASGPTAYPMQVSVAQCTTRCSNLLCSVTGVRCPSPPPPPRR